MDRHKKEHKFQNKRCYKNLQYNCCVYFFSFIFCFVLLFLLGAVGPICILGTPISKVVFRIGVPKIQKKYHYTVQKFREILDPEHPLAKTITLDKWKCPYHFIKRDPQPPFFVMYIITYHLFIHKSRLCSEYQDMYKYTT